MAEVDNVGTKILSELLKNSLTNDTSTISKNINDVIADINNAKKNKTSAFIDEETLEKLKDGQFGITLKQFTNLNTYSTKMNALYGNSSLTGNLTNNLTSNLTNNLISKKNNLLISNDSENALSNAKSFVEKMKEYGMTNANALKLYTAMSSYSAFSTLGTSATNSYVSAKI